MAPKTPRQHRRSQLLCQQGKAMAHQFCKRIGKLWLEMINLRLQPIYTIQLYNLQDVNKSLNWVKVRNKHLRSQGSNWNCSGISVGGRMLKTHSPQSQWVILLYSHQLCKLVHSTRMVCRFKAVKCLRNSKNHKWCHWNRKIKERNRLIANNKQVWVKL